MPRFLLDDELTSFVASPHAVVIATRSAALVPEATRACGLRVVDREHIDLWLPRETSGAALKNLRDNGEIAVCVSSPRTYETAQLKGRCMTITDATEEDRVLCEAHLRAFSAACASLGMPRSNVRNLWLFETWRVRVHLTSAYVQTPGPGAGEPMESARGR